MSNFFNNILNIVLRQSKAKRVHADKNALTEKIEPVPSQSLIKAVDDLEHAINFARSSSSPITHGLELVMSKFVLAINNDSFEFINPIGIKFDPNLHSAVDYKNSDKDEGEIICVLQSGYSINGKIIRFPQVVVSSGK